MPAVNYALMIACLGVVIGFGESSSLAGAYGIAVTGTMTITSILYFVVITRVWKWSLWLAIPLITLFLVFDLSYFGANLLKVKEGGWFTLVAAGLLTIAMTTWRKGRSELIRKLETRVPLDLFLEDVHRQNPPRVQGTAVFMSVSPEWTSPVLLHNLKYNKILHEKVALLSILPADIPKVPIHERVKVKNLGQDFYRVLAYNGYMQRPNVPEIIKLASHSGLPIDEAETTYYLGRVSLFPIGGSRMMRWRKVLFAFMSRNAATSAAYYGLPANRVVEFGSQIQL
jgi:KUP system potassium uptake protein